MEHSSAACSLLWLVMSSGVIPNVSLPSNVVVTEVDTYVGIASNRGRCDNIYCLSNDG